MSINLSRRTVFHAALRRSLGVSLSAMLVAGTGLAFASDLPVTPAVEGATVTIISPQDGDTVSAEFTVYFGLSGMGVAPAGTDNPTTGHHHLLIDQETLPEEGKPMGNPPMHFGGGQTQTTLTLEPGEHTLQLILGDKFHIPHDPPVVSDKITITVTE